MNDPRSGREVSCPTLHIHAVTAPDEPSMSIALTSWALRLEQPAIRPPMTVSGLLVLVMPAAQPPLLPPFGGYRPEPIALLHQSQPLPFLQGLIGHTCKRNPHERSRPLSMLEPVQSELEVQQRQFALCMKSYRKAMKQLRKAAKGLTY